MEIRDDAVGRQQSNDDEREGAPIRFALPVFMAVFMAFVSVPLFWPERMENRLAYGENMYLGGLTVAVLMGVAVLGVAVVVCGVQLLRR